jgi:hypothetical protein
MVPLILVLLLALILFGAGFALKALWWIAVVPEPQVRAVVGTAGSSLTQGPATFVAGPFHAPTVTIAIRSGHLTNGLHPRGGSLNSERHRP